MRVAPGAMSPRASASSIKARPTRSFTLPKGLSISSLASKRPRLCGNNLPSWTRGVLPIALVTSLWIKGNSGVPWGRGASVVAKGHSTSQARIDTIRPNCTTLVSGTDDGRIRQTDAHRGRHGGHSTDDGRRAGYPAAFHPAPRRTAEGFQIHHRRSV